jgi:hypothetical protein
MSNFYCHPAKGGGSPFAFRKTIPQTEALGFYAGLRDLKDTWPGRS